MAVLFLNKVTTLGVPTGIDSVSWYVAKDKDFTKIIDKSERDTVNMEKWVTMLPKLPEDGPGYYKAEDELWIKIIVHYKKFSSEPYIRGPYKQGDREVSVSFPDSKEDVIRDVEEIGMILSK